MLYIITGGSGSGKSEYAENLAVDLFQGSSKRQNGTGRDFGKAVLYYLATMYPYDEESRQRIERHQIQRAGKGFTTKECPVKLEQVNAKEGDVLLLEDLSNLLANEMYLESGRIKARHVCRTQSQLEQAILFPLLDLEKQAGNVIIVTNEIFADGVEYDEEAKWYIGLLGQINQKLAGAADGVIEVVCGIPLWHKRKI